MGEHAANVMRGKTSSQWENMQPWRLSALMQWVSANTGRHAARVKRRKTCSWCQQV